VCAVFLAIILAGQDASAQRAFSEIKNVNDVAISLQRGGGMGWGPSYRILISGNGNVKYEGYGGVFTRGQRTARISKVAVDQLIEEFHKAGFFELQDDYRSAASDLPVCVIQFVAGPNTKKIVDYGLHSSDQEGFRSGAPPNLLQLENRIDEAANSRRWVNGSWLRKLVRWH
jgi:hypothetical protein